MNKQDLIYNIPVNIQSLYNRYIDLAKFHLNYTFLLMIDYNNVQELINKFNTHPDVILMKNEYNKKVLNYKAALKNLNGKLYITIPFTKEIDIDNITGLWMRQSPNNSNRDQYFLCINNKLVDNTNLYFDVDKNKTEEINQLGFLNKFQYDILYNNSDNNRYLNYLRIYLFIDPLILSAEYLRAQLLTIINNLSYTNVDIIKKYWLLPEFTKEDQYKIDDVLSKKLLSKI